MKRAGRMRRMFLPVLALALAFVLAMPAVQAQAAKKVKLNKTKLTLKVGETAKLKLLNAPKGKKIKWTSSGISVVYVWEDGTIRADKIGKAKIKAAVSGKKYTCVVTVIKGNGTSGKDDSGKTESDKINGRNKSDLEALKKIVAEQKGKGALGFSEKYFDNKSDQYTWDGDGRLIGISWNQFTISLQGDLSLSGLPKLQWFSCYQSFELTGLDVSGCKELKNLDCMICGLTSLNISGCESLSNLNCSGNQLDSLDLKDCIKLTFLCCDDNPLGSLDLSRCTALRTLYCRRCGLTDLNVGKCTKIELLDCLDNKLTSLDVSKCTRLKDLYCTDNQITSLDLSKNKKLKNLSCDDSVNVTR